MYNTIHYTCILRIPQRTYIYIPEPVIESMQQIKYKQISHSRKKNIVDWIFLIYFSGSIKIKTNQLKD